MNVDDEYTARQMDILTNKLGKKLGKDIKMKWQITTSKDGVEKISCDFYKYD